MNISSLRRKTFLTLLCCILILSAIGVSQAAAPAWWVSLWNWITGLKDTVEGITALISALETDIEQAKDQIARINKRKNGHLRARNNVKRKIQAKEQELNSEIKNANAAAAAYNAASRRARKLRREISVIEAQLRLVSRSGNRYLELMQALLAKNTALAMEEATMTEEKARYEKAKAAVKRLRAELKADWAYIAYLTGLIDQCDADIAALNAKIKKKQEKIKAEKERRERVEAEIEQREAEWEELEKKSIQPKI